MSKPKEKKMTAKKFYVVWTGENEDDVAFVTPVQKRAEEVAKIWWEDGQSDYIFFGEIIVKKVAVCAPSEMPWREV